MLTPENNFFIGDIINNIPHELTPFRIRLNYKWMRDNGYLIFAKDPSLVNAYFIFKKLSENEYRYIGYSRLLEKAYCMIKEDALQSLNK